MITEFVKVATIGDLDDNDMMMVEAEGEEYLLARINGEYYCIDNWCTHAQAMLDQGELFPASYEVECPLHEGRIDLRTGEPTSLPIEDGVAHFAVKVEGDAIFIGPVA
jgi:nitrite reductase/ring-hydroxylating ferredoxin subunit